MSLHLSDSVNEQPELSYARLAEPLLTPEMKEKIAAWKKTQDPLYSVKGHAPNGKAYDHRHYPPMPETTERWMAEVAEIEDMIQKGDTEQIYRVFDDLPLPEALEHLREHIPKGVIKRMNNPKYAPEHAPLLALFIWVWMKREVNPPVADYASKIYSGDKMTLEEIFETEFFSCVDRAALQSHMLTQMGIEHHIHQQKKADPHVCVQLASGPVLDLGVGLREGGLFFRLEDQIWQYTLSTIMVRTKRLLQKAGLESISNFFRRFL